MDQHGSKQTINQDEEENLRQQQQQQQMLLLLHHQYETFRCHLNTVTLHLAASGMGTKKSMTVTSGAMDDEDDEDDDDGAEDALATHVIGTLLRQLHVSLQEQQQQQLQQQQADDDESDDDDDDENDEDDCIDKADEDDEKNDMKELEDNAKEDEMLQENEATATSSSATNEKESTSSFVGACQQHAVHCPKQEPQPEEYYDAYLQEEPTLPVTKALQLPAHTQAHLKQLNPLVFAHPFVVGPIRGRRKTTGRSVVAIVDEASVTAASAVAIFNLGLAWHTQGMMMKGITTTTTATTTTGSSQQQQQQQEAKVLLQRAYQTYQHAYELLNNSHQVLMAPDEGTLVYVYLALCVNLSEIATDLGDEIAAREWQQILQVCLEPVPPPVPDEEEEDEFVDGNDFWAASAQQSSLMYWHFHNASACYEMDIELLHMEADTEPLSVPSS